MTLILHAYWRSGTFYRTRIALNLKGLELPDPAGEPLAGEQGAGAYRENRLPKGLVPTLEAEGRR